MALPRIAPLLLSALFSTVVWAAPAPSIQEASQQFKQGRHQVALDKVNGFLAGNPKDAQGRFLKGLILTELNRHQEAIRVFNELTEDYPDLPEPYNNLAVLYAAQGQYDKAKSSLESAIRTHPSYATAHENLGDIYAKMASQAYDKALQLDRGNVSAQTKLSMIKELLGPVRNAEPAKGKPQTSKLAADKPKAAPLASAASPTLPEPPVGQKTASLASAEAPAKGTSADQAAANPGKPAANPGFPKEVEKTVLDWAEAWSRKDVDSYLAFYADSYKPAGKDRAEWAAERRIRVTRPSHIKVDVSDLEITIRESQAEAKFKQRYESDRYRDMTTKTLTLEKQGGDWKIVEER